MRRSLSFYSLGSRYRLLFVRFAALFLVLIASLLGAAEAQVSRREALQVAEAYRTFRWTPSVANVHHGADPDGIHVDTPDRGFSRRGIRPGWWTLGRENIGVPYMWGGFSSLADFAAGLKRGRFAGDVYTLEKRKLGDAGVSRFAVGIDCSGLVSRCWNLDRAYSTKELPSLCVQLRQYSDLRPGDILNTPNDHVLLFKAFADPAQNRILAYEAGSPPTWKVLLNNIPVAMLKDQGYQPLRFRGIIE